MKTTNNKNYEQAKQAAQRIFKRVNYDGGNLQTYQLSSLLQQTYDFLKIPFKPTTNDLKQYAKVLDANGDGAVSLQDLQALSIQYLCGEGVLGGSTSTQPTSSNRFDSSQYSSSSYQNTANDYTSSGLNQNAQRGSKFDSESYNYGGYNQYGSGSQYNDQSYTNSGYNNYGGYQENAYGGKSSFSGTGAGNFQYGGSNYSASNADINQYGKSSYSGVSNTYSNAQNYSSVAQTQQHLTSKHYNQAPVPQPKSKYTPTAQNYLNITRSLFTKYANRPSNTITRDRVAQLLNQTYSALGRKGYHPSEEDINVWMKLCDTNSDGHVEEAEYEYFVVRALERSGVQVNA